VLVRTDRAGALLFTAPRNAPISATSPPPSAYAMTINCGPRSAGVNRNQTGPYRYPDASIPWTAPQLRRRSSGPAIPFPCSPQWGADPGRLPAPRPRKPACLGERLTQPTPGPNGSAPRKSATKSALAGGPVVSACSLGGPDLPFPAFAATAPGPREIPARPRSFPGLRLRRCARWCSGGDARPGLFSMGVDRIICGTNPASCLRRPH